MDRYKKNESIVECLAVCYKQDKEVVRQYVHACIDRGEYVLEFGKLNKLWGGRSFQLGKVFDNYNDGRPTLDKQAYAKGGKIWRKMSMGTFRKLYPTGTYMITLEDRAIVLRERTDIVGDYNSKSRILSAAKITKI